MKFQADCVDHRLRGSNALVDCREIGMKRGLEIARTLFVYSVSEPLAKVSERGGSYLPKAKGLTLFWLQDS